MHVDLISKRENETSDDGLEKRCKRPFRARKKNNVKQAVFAGGSLVSSNFRNRSKADHTNTSIVKIFQSYQLLFYGSMVASYRR